MHPLDFISKYITKSDIKKISKDNMEAISKSKKDVDEIIYLMERYQRGLRGHRNTVTNITLDAAKGKMSPGQAIYELRELEKAGEVLLERAKKIAEKIAAVNKVYGKVIEIAMTLDQATTLLEHFIKFNGKITRGAVPEALEFVRTLNIKNN